MAARIRIERLYDADARSWQQQADDPDQSPTTRTRARGVAQYLRGQAAEAGATRRRERGEDPR